MLDALAGRCVAMETVVVAQQQVSEFVADGETQSRESPRRAAEAPTAATRAFLTAGLRIATQRSVVRLGCR
jgi:hypothetical protein